MRFFISVFCDFNIKRVNQSNDFDRKEKCNRLAISNKQMYLSKKKYLENGG